MQLFAGAAFDHNAAFHMDGHVASALWLPLGIHPDEDGIVALFGASLPMITFAIGVVSWTAVARITRSEFLRIRELEYVTASRASGASNTRLMFRVILPNALPPIIVQAALMVGSAILFEAGLSFLGLTDPNVVSWGQVRASVLSAKAAAENP